MVITEGLFAQAREQLASSSPSAKTRDEAIDLVTTIPAAWYGAIEVRPARQMQHRPSWLGSRHQFVRS